MLKKILYWGFVVFVFCACSFVVPSLPPVSLTTGYHISEMTLYENSIYFSAGYCVYKMDIESNEMEKILCDNGTTFNQPHVKDSMIIIGSKNYLGDGCKLSLINAQQNAFVWKIEQKDISGYFTKNTVFAISDTVVSLNEDDQDKSHLYGYDLATGRQLWESEFPVSSSFGFYNNSLWYLVKASDRGWLRNRDKDSIMLIDPETGKFEQELEWRNKDLSEVLFVNDDVIVGFERVDMKYKLIAIQRLHPDVKIWEADWPEFTFTSAELNDNHLIVKGDEHIYAFDFDNGVVIWQVDGEKINIEKGGESNQISILSVEDQNKLLGVDLLSGKIVWEYELQGDQSRYLVHAGRVYVVNETTLDILDLKTGALISQRTMDSTFQYYIREGGL